MHWLGLPLLVLAASTAQLFQTQGKLNHPADSLDGGKGSVGPGCALDAVLNNVTCPDAKPRAWARYAKLEPTDTVCLLDSRCGPGGALDAVPDAVTCPNAKPRTWLCTQCTGACYGIWHCNKCATWAHTAFPAVK